MLSITACIGISRCGKYVTLSQAINQKINAAGMLHFLQFDAEYIHNATIKFSCDIVTNSTITYRNQIGYCL